MNQILINGKERDIPAQAEWEFRDLLNYLRTSINSDFVSIASVIVDGQELTLENEQKLSSLPLTSIGHVEVETSNPRELAEQTLQTLLGFLEQVSMHSKRVSVEDDAIIMNREFLRLVDSLEQIAETVSGIKVLLKIQSHPVIELLELEMITLLRELLECKKSNSIDRMRVILKRQLPENLYEWSTMGIPALIRSRDN